MIQNPLIYQTTTKNINFQLISSSLELNNTAIYGTNAILDTYQSYVKIQDVKIYDIKSTSGYSFKFTTTRIEILRMNINNCSSSSRSPLMSVTLNSNLNTDGLIFKNSNIALFKILSSQALLQRLELYNISSLFSVFHIYKVTNLILKNFELGSISADNNLPILIHKSYVKEINNITLSKINQQPITFRKSQVEMIIDTKILL